MQNRANSRKIISDRLLTVEDGLGCQRFGARLFFKLLKVVAGGGIEPPTQGFSVLCYHVLICPDSCGQNIQIRLIETGK